MARRREGSGQPAVAAYDSASSMVRAIAAFLHGRDAPLLALGPAYLEPLLQPLLRGLNRTPRVVREQLVAWGGISEAVPVRRIVNVDSEATAAYVTGLYPRRRYPAVFVGSSNGAVVHLAAALGVPWLPQTLLLPVRHRPVDIDDPQQVCEATLEAARALLDANPGIALHQMHDPVQDRLPVRRMSYFRAKFLKLPAAYRRFLDECLAPGGEVVVVDCDYRWPTTRLGDRHVFQFGGVGGAGIEELFDGSERVRTFLAAHGSRHTRWCPPEPDGERPEAEWGLRPELLDDLLAYAAERPAALRRLRFSHPMSVSPLVADLHRDWNRRRGVPSERLLMEQFLYVAPWSVLRLGLVPFWTLFGTVPSWRRASDYLARAEPYDEIWQTLFSHGTMSIGMATGEEWAGLLSHARAGGGFIGHDPAAYPLDLRTIVGFHHDLTRLPGPMPMPAPMPLSELDGLVDGSGGGAGPVTVERWEARGSGPCTTPR